MVFCNRTLNLKKIDYIGLDMDHTLVQYNSKSFEELSYNSMKKKLVEEFHYPKEILEFEFDYQRAIRGLVIDKISGNIFKVSRYGMVKEARHGLSKIEYKDQVQQFGDKFIDLKDSNFDCIDTNFSISHACLFSQVVEFKKTNQNIPDYPVISENLISVLDSSHRDGSIKNEVTQNPAKYIKKSEAIVRGIKKYIKHGKKFFIATNSDFNYTDKVLTYTINPFLDEGQTWQDLFDYTFTLCMKPKFFYLNMPLLKIDTKTGYMINWDKPIEKGVYQGGSANLFAKGLKIEGDRILYIGDHIYGDILMLKKNCGWRTALIVEELAKEIEQNQKALPLTNEIKILMNQKKELEYYLNQLVDKALEENLDRQDEEKNVLAEILKIDERLSPLIQKRNAVYNEYWGSIMRAGVEESQFANQVEGFSDIYMANLTDFLKESPRTYFRSYIRKMAHD